MEPNATNNEMIRLTDQAGLSGDLRRHTRRADDRAWIEVIERMDTIYADLVTSQVALEQKNSELENAQRFIRSVLSSMSEILIVCDLNGRVLQVNPALCEALQMDTETLEGMSLEQLFSADHQPLLNNFQEHLRSDHLIDCEADLLDHDGRRVPMAINCKARYDHENRLSGLVITGRPLGELRKAYAELKQAHEELKATQQQLLQSEKMASLGRLVAGVAHELNNPISFLFANMHVLKDYHQKFQRYLDCIHMDGGTAAREQLRRELRIDDIMEDTASLVEGSLEGAERVSDIVQNLRRFSTPQVQPRKEFDLIPVIQRALNWVRKSTVSEIRVIEELPEKLTLFTHEGHVHQILVNLFQNAIDALSDSHHKQIRIRAERSAETIRLYIADSGHGISETNRLRIFDPFFTTKPVGSGTGLGLYISYHLAQDQLGGKLQLLESSGQETVFLLELPCCALEEPS